MSHHFLSHIFCPDKIKLHKTSYINHYVSFLYHNSVNFISSIWNISNSNPLTSLIFTSPHTKLLPGLFFCFFWTDLSTVSSTEFLFSSKFSRCPFMFSLFSVHVFTAVIWLHWSICLCVCLFWWTEASSRSGTGYTIHLWVPNTKHRL